MEVLFGGGGGIGGDGCDVVIEGGVGGEGESAGSVLDWVEGGVSGVLMCYDMNELEGAGV